MTEGWLWSTPLWQEYLAAYGPHQPHTGTRGNMIVRLGPSQTMWAGLRKGHRADVGRAEGSLDCVVDTTGGDFELYRLLHIGQHGLVRPPKTYEIQKRFVEQGNALLFLARRLRYASAPVEYIAAAYFYVYERGAYYGSAARADECGAQMPMHFLVWRAMNYLAARGYEWLDLGPVPEETASEKEKSVAFFKRGFGPEVRLVV